MQFGDNFRRIRKQNGLSQKQVAQRLGIYQSNISDWENDISRPSFEYLIALAELYEATLHEMLGLDDPFFPTKKLRRMFCGNNFSSRAHLKGKLSSDTVLSPIKRK